MTASPATEAMAAASAPAGRGGGLRLLRIGALVAAGLVVLPLLAVVVMAASFSDALPHLWRTVMPQLALNTLLLMAGVGISVIMLGCGAAWLVVRYRFPGHGIMQWALALPLAVPGYLVAFIYTDLLEYAGPVQKALRELFGWQGPRDYYFPEIRSLPGAVMVLSLTLYPYVYLLARVAFMAQSASLLEAARLLGRKPWPAFFAVALPVAWPAVAAGTALALMEVLNDFGVVDFFAVPTFTAGIFDVWLNMNDAAGAAQLALVLLVFTLLLILLERMARRRRRFDTAGPRAAGRGWRLRGWKAALALAACLLPVVLGFVLPVAVLLMHAARFWQESLQQGLMEQLFNTLLLASVVSLTAALLALVLAFAARLDGSATVRGAVRLAGIGYAMPGAMLAVGLLMALAWADGLINDAARAWLGMAPGLLLSGTMFALAHGHVSRFLALALGSIESGLARISPSMEAAARTLGARPAEVLRRVHLPMLRGSVLTALLIVFVDSVKELPMTLLLRPFGFSTLATQTYQFASDEMFEEAALGALFIVMAGIIPLILLVRAMNAPSSQSETARF